MSVDYQFKNPNYFEPNKGYVSMGWVELKLKLKLLFKEGWTFYQSDHFQANQWDNTGKMLMEDTVKPSKSYSAIPGPVWFPWN